MNLDEVIKRDVLAKHRTELANQRTFLSYLRTALTIFVLGIGLVKLFSNNEILVGLGIIALFSGFYIMVIGILVYISFNSKIKKAYNSART